MKDELEIVIVSKQGPDNSKLYAAYPKWFIFEPGGVYQKNIPEAIEYFKRQLLRHFGNNIPARNFAWKAFNGKRSMEEVNRYKKYLTPEKIDSLPISVQEGERYLLEKGAAGWGRALKFFDDQNEFTPENMISEDLSLYYWLQEMAVTAGYTNLSEALAHEVSFYE